MQWLLQRSLRLSKRGGDHHLRKLQLYRRHGGRHLRGHGQRAFTCHHRHRYFAALAILFQLTKKQEIRLNESPVFCFYTTINCRQQLYFPGQFLPIFPKPIPILLPSFQWFPSDPKCHRNSWSIHLRSWEPSDP